MYSQHFYYKRLHDARVNADVAASQHVGLMLMLACFLFFFSFFFLPSSSFISKHII